MATKTPQEVSDVVEVIHTKGWRFPMNCSVCNNGTNKFVMMKIENYASPELPLQVCVCVHCLEELLEKSKE